MKTASLISGVLWAITAILTGYYQYVWRLNGDFEVTTSHYYYAFLSILVPATLAVFLFVIYGRQLKRQE